MEVQGQLRLGYGDMGVNRARNLDLLSFLDNSSFQPSKCSGR